jgi:hypothetical protein
VISAVARGYTAFEACTDVERTLHICEAFLTLAYCLVAH